jgi:hypothetical protein
VYHIENFLLHPRAIRAACATLAGKEVFESDDAVLVALADVASSLVTALVKQELQAEINDELVGAIAIGAGSDSTAVAQGLLPSISGSIRRINEQAERYSLEELQTKEANSEREMQEILDSGEWIKRYPGREILKRFAGRHLEKVGYEIFRNVVMEQMAQSDYRPENMQTVLEDILSSGAPVAAEAVLGG